MESVKLRVLDIRENPNIGGINTQLIRLYPSLSKFREIDFHCAYLYKEPIGWLVNKANQINMPIDWIPYYGPRDIKVLVRLNNYIKKNNIQIIHTHGFRANTLVRALLDLKICSVSTIITKHGTAGDNSAKIRFYWWLDQRPTRLADKVIAVDRATRKVMENWGVKSERLHVIPNPIEIPRQNIVDRGRITNSLMINENSRIILFIGRLVQDKGVFELLDSFSNICKIREDIILLYVGEGSAMKILEERTRNLGLTGKVKILGYQLNVDPFIAISEMVVLPSYSEGLPYAILEAMANGKPVIASNVGGIPDAIENGVNGFLIPPKSVEALDEKILSLLNMRDYAEEIGGKGKKSVANKFHPDVIAEQIKDLYFKVYSRNG